MNNNNLQYKRDGEWYDVTWPLRKAYEYYLRGLLAESDVETVRITPSIKGPSPVPAPVTYRLKPDPIMPVVEGPLTADEVAKVRQLIKTHSEG